MHHLWHCLTIGIIHESMVVHMTWVWTFFNNYSNHPCMCVLSTLRGYVDKHGPFDIYIYIYILKLSWYIYIFPLLFVWATPIVDFHTSSLSSSVIWFTVIPNVLAFEHGWIFMVSTVPLKVWPNIGPSLCLSSSVAWMLHRPWYLVTWFILSIFIVRIISQNLFPFWTLFCDILFFN